MLLSSGGSQWNLIRNACCTVTIDSSLCKLWSTKIFLFASQHCCYWCFLMDGGGNIACTCALVRTNKTVWVTLSFDVSFIAVNWMNKYYKRWTAAIHFETPSILGYSGSKWLLENFQICCRVSFEMDKDCYVAQVKSMRFFVLLLVFSIVVFSFKFCMVIFPRYLNCETDFISHGRLVLKFC